MTIKIRNKKLSFNKQSNLVLFTNDDIEIMGLSNNYVLKYKKLLKDFVSYHKKKIKNFFCLDLSPVLRVIIIKIDEDIKHQSNNEKLAASFYNFLNKSSLEEVYFLATNIRFFSKENSNFFEEFISGILIKSYFFEKYKSNKKTKFFSINIDGSYKTKIFKKENRLNSIIEGVNLTKDLVSEPGNVLSPDEYIKRIKMLRSIGLKITVYDKKKLKKIGMNALLGVGQGSTKGSYLATIEWKGSTKKQKPLAFVGKGVCFDTGGISLKPAKFMEDMTYDMAGSAVVVGLMKTLALRNAKINAVGVVGLVENMPDGNAQRPGDIVKSYSGKTIEILNTDAEGRLVLADALTYTEKKYKPKFIVDLATLTGAIIVSLGSEYAGLFSNDDKISDQLSKAGEKVGEKVWRMPLNKNYDKLINSKKADMQNINYVGGAGSTTAAQFLQRFILNKTPWAHLDIAGMAFSKYGGALNSGGATGYGVRLLNQLIEDNYE
jgi:leucyl aminopeptidase